MGTDVADRSSAAGDSGISRRSFPWSVGLLVLLVACSGVETRDASDGGTAAREVVPSVPADAATRGARDSAFRIQPLRPIPELRAAALAAEPPEEEGDFLAPDLVDLATLDSSIQFDIRYATSDNFMGVPFYESERAFLQRPAAEALLRVHRSLEPLGYGLLIHDAYRPWFVTRMFWDATPEELKDFVADPSRGSRHNRGAAVDLTLYDRSTGEAVEMPSGYDEFSERASPDYHGGTDEQRAARDLLRRHMEENGFEVYEYEWWHFDYEDWRRYPIMNRTFEELAADSRSAG
jgi:D-alanyl-D-alanine dipeptidase